MTSTEVPVVDATPGKICDDCVSGGLIPGTPQGTMSDLGGMKYYVAEGKGEGKADRAIVICTDLFGLGIDNTKLVADSIAGQSGFTVYVPDVLQGDYPPMSKLVSMDTPIGGLPLHKRVAKIGAVMLSFMRFVGPMFLYRHRMSVMMPMIEKFAVDLKAEKGIEHIGLVGYCLGGKLATFLASSATLPLKAVVVAHPAPLAASDFATVKAPFALVCSGEDFAFDSVKKDAIKVLEQVKTADGVKLPIAIYEHPGTTHGFGARPDLREPVTEAAYRKALEQTSEWFKLHL
ncbi:hypothetical protein RQP46_009884 [Phenoliferia psychrophenolica]